jgi:hypothetical protein
MKQKATTSITLDKAIYWELKAAILQMPSKCKPKRRRPWSRPSNGL